MDRRRNPAPWPERPPDLRDPARPLFGLASLDPKAPGSDSEADTKARQPARSGRRPKVEETPRPMPRDRLLRDDVAGLKNSLGGRARVEAEGNRGGLRGRGQGLAFTRRKRIASGSARKRWCRSRAREARRGHVSASDKSRDWYRAPPAPPYRDRESCRPLDRLGMHRHQTSPGLGPGLRPPLPLHPVR